MPTHDEIIEALRFVLDPELGISIVDLGLIYDVETKDGDVTVTMTLTSPACPAGPFIRERVRDVIFELPGVETVSVELVWFPPWDPQTMPTEDGKAALGIW
jgi:metal-sulfur cluster biosynthetic enzyme